MNATPPQSIDPTYAATQQPWLPVLLIILGMIVIPGMDAIAKGLTGLATVPTLSLIRNLTQLLIMGPVAWRTSAGKLWPLPHLKLHALRGFFMVSSGMLFFAGLQRLPLADNMALSFIYPFMVACIAPVLLKEQINRWQMIAILLGFAGAMIIIRPGSGIFGISALLPLTSALGFAGYVLATRKLMQLDASTSELQFWTSVFASLWVLPVFAIGWAFELPAAQFHLVNTQVLLWAIAIGLLGTVGFGLITLGARHVSTNVLAGLGYSEIITTTVLGWVFWHDFPDQWTWLGIVVIVCSGIWLVQLQRV
jgi:S-adenosylmethionine uptake transporter